MGKKKLPPGAAAAVSAYEEFTGHKATKVETVNLQLPACATKIGSLLGVAYEAVRDGKKEKYFHEFNRKSRPTLAVSVSSPGKPALLIIVGGHYTFTDHGIEDLR